MSSGEADNDPVVRELRDQIATNDLSLLEAVNRRVELVRRLKEHKDSRGIEFVDHAQEERLLDRLAAANRGPMSEESVRDLYRTLLELTKKEL
jgi:chorismate mutase/prephenate dehydratase